MKKFLKWVLIIFGSLIVAFLVFRFVMPPALNKLNAVLSSFGGPQQQARLLSAKAGACPAAGTPLYTRFPIDLTNSIRIIPLGNPDPEGGHVFPTIHIYIQPRHAGDTRYSQNFSPVPLYAPGNITIVGITRQHNITQGFYDYAVQYASCDGVTGTFYHVNTLASAILSSLSSDIDKHCGADQVHGQNTYQQCQIQEVLPLKVGEKIGTVWGSQYLSFDWELFDYRQTPKPVADPARYTGLSAANIVCAIDYYSPAMQQKIDALFSDYSGNPLHNNPICGVAAQDVAGTAQGNWFNTKNPVDLAGGGGQDSGLALLHDNFQYQNEDISIGTGMQDKDVQAQILEFVPQESGQINRDFAQVKPDGQVYCYDAFFNGRDSYNEPDANQRVLIQLTNANTLSIELQKGKTCAQTPYQFSSPSTFYR